MALAGFLLCSLLQLASAQQQRSLSVASQPASPKEFQNVTLFVRGGPPPFTSCRWQRDAQGGRKGSILDFSPDGRPQVNHNEAYTGREQVDRNCSLLIQRVLTHDAGMYTVTLRTSSTQQQGDADQQRETEQQGTVSLQVSGSNKITLQIQTTPRHPSPGQRVLLAPQGLPEQVQLCEWSKQTESGAFQVVKTYTHEERQQTTAGDQQERDRVHQLCSLEMPLIRTSDAGTYSLYIEAPLNLQQQQPGREAAQLRYEETQFYTGLVKVEVSGQSQTDPHTAGASSLSYSPGAIMAAILLGSFSEPIMAAFSTLFGSLASLRPRIFQ